MCKKSVMIGVLSAMLLLGSAVAHAGSDVFSVNFYAFGRTNQGAGTEWNQEEWQKTVLLEEGQAAGVDDWNTTGWENIVMPWAPSAPQDPVTITSNQGSTATFTLITVRNGNPRYRTRLRDTLLDDANADMMDGHANGTEDDGELFDMTVSDIPFGLYDVIIYMGTQEAQFGDGTAKIVFNGGPEQDFTLPSGEFATFTEIVDGTTPGNYILFEGVEGSSFTVQAWGNGFNHIALTGFQFRQAAPELAADPDPANEVTDVLRDVILSWTPGESANTHNVYLGTVFDNVNDAVLADAVSPGQTDTTYDPGRLEFGTTYYWRVDEVNAPPTSHIEFKGEVWSFTTEPIAYPIDGNNITATASSAHLADTGTENTINGSGLDANDLHSTEATDMWLSSDEPNGAWIEYELDKVHKLHEMWAWNHNGTMEPVLGFGLKDVTIEYSTNGIDYTTLGTTHEFVRASGEDDYAHNTTVDFGGAAAKYVRLTANSNWGGLLDQYGLSEVRFFYIPVYAREPSPDSGTTDVAVEATLSFRAGREAAKHNVYLDTDEQAVIDGTALVDTVTENSYSASLDVDSTYYWRVDEVNDAETPTTWQGDIWNFSTPEFFVVDDFEDYNDWPPDEIWSTWVDGYGVPANGATVGYPNPDWNLGEHYVETTIVHGGSQSMPFFYDNTGTAAYSEGERTFAVPQDWTKAGIQTLVLYFRGEPSNAVEQMYVKLNGSKVLYDGDAADISQPRWMAWNIPLEDFANQGVDLQSVTTLAIGIEGSGASGTLYFDDIRLYRPGTSDVSGITITVPNGDFEEIYKPGSTTITADLGDGWTQGVGPDTLMDDGIATYSDGTTGDGVDIPGWIGADPQGWIDGGGSYDRDTNFPNRQGSVARQSSTPDGLYYYLSNGGGWGNPAGGLIVSDAPLGNVEDRTYTLSMLANGGATPVVLELLADGVALTPSSSVDPVLSDEWQEFSRTYDAASLGGHLGESLTIRLGVGRGASGAQSHFDAVSLSYVPEPVSLIEDFDSLAVGSNMHDVPGWEGWYGDAQWGARVTDAVAYSGTNSLEIVGNRDDLVPNWPQQTTGRWILSVMQYCPSDKQTTGLVYFGPLAAYDSAAETIDWIGEFMANFGTGKAYCNQDQAIQVDLVYDDWAELRLEVDLDAQKADFYYNNVFLSTQPASSIAGVDIWPDGNIVGIYFDDFRFEAAE